ncbi:MAG TPA: class II aldolase/adducin family protein [Kiritimatiellia bacterium]|nr:class II aldolase/adducin family protein [Kiritimatiellia bacterium]
MIMFDSLTQLANYGRRLAQQGLCAGAGGNISYRDGNVIWVKPSGFSMEDLKVSLFAGLNLATGKQLRGDYRASSEAPMHLEIYRRCPAVNAIFHTHPPWLCGVISSNAEFKPMFPEVVADLGGLIRLPYLLTGSQALADAVAGAAEGHGTILMENHGLVCTGASMKQAYYRTCVAEDAAKSFVAACAVGRPRFLSDEQVAELQSLEAGAYREGLAAEEQ